MKTEPFVDDVLRKIGRNMVLFQQLEGLLKYIISRSSISATPQELQNVMGKRSEKVYRQTLGQLVGQYVEEHLGPEPESTEPDPEDHFTLKFRVRFNEGFYAGKKEALAKIVTDRNDLIHHLLPELDTSSEDSCRKLGEKLDSQCETVRLEIKCMQSIGLAMQEGYLKVFSEM